MGRQGTCYTRKSLKCLYREKRHIWSLFQVLLSSHSGGCSPLNPAGSTCGLLTVFIQTTYINYAIDQEYINFGSLHSNALDYSLFSYLVLRVRASFCNIGSFLFVLFRSVLQIPTPRKSRFLPSLLPSLSPLRNAEELTTIYLL